MRTKLALGLAGVGMLALLIAAAPSPVAAAANATLQDVTATCSGFSLTAVFDATVAEEDGLDYVRLRVIDAGGNVVFTAAPWSWPAGLQAEIEFHADYAYTPVAGPLLFVLEDFDLRENQRLGSLATAIVITDCPNFARVEQPDVALLCSTRLRIGPGLSYPWRRFLPQGETFTVIGRLYDSSWLEVRTSEGGLLGWVFDGLCVPGSPAEATYRAMPVTFFRTPDEILMYQAALR